MKGPVQERFRRPLDNHEPDGILLSDIIYLIIDV